MEIPGSELLTAVFGYWPSFHDAEVRKISLETTLPFAAGPDLVALIRTCELAKSPSPDGGLLAGNQALVSLRFRGIDELKLLDFNNQNVLWELSIVDIRDRQLEFLNYDVSFESSYGVSTRFLCSEAIVESVEPTDARQ